ncbi:Arm DNA-binding domain-containing protein [Nostoc sp. 'Peltigera membranacea cyanobiont' 232]|uniref:Arm DNA-binding domain-containing protein n=1 Tax=Nostoc sp. 'Peltigera membranacea cyanobiont' 232 TaxID=2014531 RepID=UPI001676BD1D|nr:Arm DNA-binding domain-containing protein [Nostoc sp. 'Peltigera membranacea cyanobiont' 232]
MNQPTLFDLEAFTLSSVPIPLYDPAWDEVETAPEHPQPEQRWNPADFGEAPRKLSDNGQLTIFFDDTDEPPDPDDYQNLDDYHQAWGEWEILVGGQVSQGTKPHTAESLVGEQVTTDTKKSAPQHDTHWVERYWVQRSGNKYWYFRYCWMTGRKIGRLYLGSVNSVIAKRKKADVETAIADGATSAEIREFLKTNIVFKNK